MNIITLDFETYFDDEYTLKKLTTEEYIRDPRFEVLGVGYRSECLGVPYAYWYAGAEFKQMLAGGRLDFSKSAVLCHHSHFDGLILSHHFGVKPYAWLDTLSMARLLLGNHLSVGLDALARHFGLAGKTVPYDLFKGKKWAELPPNVQRQVSEGCLHDVELTWQLFNILAKDFPVEEYAIVDQTIRMFTEPAFHGDVELLGKVWAQEQRDKKELLDRIGLTAKELGSNEVFAQCLRDRGVEPEKKPGKNGEIYAFKATDSFMKELLASEDEELALLAEARIEVKSNIDQTRATRMGWMARRGPLAVYLGYAAAHTTRWGGGDKLNFQNMRRIDYSQPDRLYLRKSLVAPEGHAIVKADKSQVECRYLNMVAGQMDVIEKFRNKEDPYVGIASKFYGREITRADSAERGVGKQLELSCGYGAGAATIVATARRGTYGPPVVLTDAEGLAARDLYRATHPGVTELWKQGGRFIARLAGGDPIQWGPVTVIGSRAGYPGRIVLPNGCPMLYPELEYYRPEFAESETATWPDEYWRYRSRKGWVKLYGAKLVENLIQGLARVDMSQTLIRVYQRTGLRPVLLEHDAGAWVAPLDKVDKLAQIIAEEMERTPAWCPDIPLGCEWSIGERYS